MSLADELSPGAFQAALKMGSCDTERRAYELGYKLECREQGKDFDPAVFTRHSDGTYVNASVETGWWAWKTRATIAHGTVNALMAAVLGGTKGTISA